jgi:hypothetical protein
MTRISSSRTFFLKRILPLLYFVIVCAPIVLGLTMPQPPPAPLLVVPVILSVVFFFVLQKFIWDLADEVYDGGDYLLVKKGDNEERVPLSNIMNVSSTLMVNPPRVTLRLVKPGKFGKEIVFTPDRPFTLNPFSPNEIVDRLIERVDQARRR